jgi:hypothetical protein
MKFSKVTLRKKKLSKGRISLYLDFYPPVLHPETGKETRREFLNLHYIDRPRTPADTTEKENALTLAASIRLKREVQVRDGQGIDDLVLDDWPSLVEVCHPGCFFSEQFRCGLQDGLAELLDACLLLRLVFVVGPKLTPAVGGEGHVG